MNKIEETSTENITKCTVPTSPNYKLKISNKLPEMTVGDDEQALILKEIFSKNFESKSQTSKIPMLHP